MEKPTDSDPLGTARLALRSVLYVASTDYLLQAFSIALSIVLTRRVVPDAFGVFALALTIRSFLHVPFSIGLNEVYIGRKGLSPAESTTHLIISTGLAIILCLGIALGSPLLMRFYRSEVVHVLIALGVIWLFGDRALASTPTCILKRDLRYARLSALSVASTVVSYLLAIGAALLGLGVWALVIREASLTLIKLVGVWVLSRWRPHLAFDWSAAKGFLRQGFDMWFQGLGTLVVLQYDDLLVGNLVGTESLGFYERAYKYSKTPMGLLSAIYAVTLPTFSRVQDDRAALSKAYTLVLDAIAILVFPVATLFAIVVPELIQLLLGTGWLPIVPLLRALLPYALLRPIGDASFQLPVATGHTRALPRVAAVQTVAMLIVCTSLTYLLGAVGAGLSAGIVQFISLLVLYRLFLSRHLDVDYARILTWPLIGAALGSSAAIGINVLLQLGPVATLIVKSLSFGAVYLGVLWLFQRQRLLQQARYLLVRLRPRENR